MRCLSLEVENYLLDLGTDSINLITCDPAMPYDANGQGQQIRDGHIQGNFHYTSPPIFR
jgi:hypothetical protein